MTATEDNPDVVISYWDGDSWEPLTAYARSFHIQDAGLLKIPTATVEIFNPEVLPSKNDRLRIWVDTTGVSYMPFYGKIKNIELTPILGTTNKKNYSLVVYGLEKRLKNDTISWKYASEDSADGDLWTFKDVIEDFLVLPDSGYDTGMTLVTDSGDILNHVATYPIDFERTSLLDALRRIAESIGYDGYTYITGEGAGSANIKFVGLGTLAASPVTTLTDPFVSEPKLIEDIDEIRNYILIWGGVDQGYPSDADKYTERPIAKYSPSLWEALDEETITDSPTDTGTSTGSNNSTTLNDTGKTWTADSWIFHKIVITSGTGKGQVRNVSDNTTTQLTVDPAWQTTPDDTSTYMIIMGDNPTFTENLSSDQLSRYSVKITKASGIYKLRFHIDRTGVSYLDLLYRYFNIKLSVLLDNLGGSFSNNSSVLVQLIDNDGNKIQKGNWAGDLYVFRTSYLGTEQNWGQISIPTGEEIDTANIKNKEHSNSWWQVTGSSFDGTKVKDVDIQIHDQDYQRALYIDKLFFAGGLKIDPFQNPEFYPKYPSQNGDPANKDETSINDNDLGVYHHDNRDITSFEQADKEGTRILSVLKNPIKTVTLTKKGYAWLRPNQTVTLNSSTLGISSESWRTVELNLAWVVNHPVYNTMKLVPAADGVPPAYSPSGEKPTSPLIPEGISPDFWYSLPGGIRHQIEYENRGGW